MIIDNCFVENSFFIFIIKFEYKLYELLLKKISFNIPYE